MSQIITTSELFRSVQGEGPLTGRPQIWIRVAKCNFQCMKFNNPDNVDTTTNEGLGFNPADYKSLDQIPEIRVGCDSIYSWDERFRHMWTDWTTDELAVAVRLLTPTNSWITPRGQEIGLTITGGEPTLRMKAIAPMLDHPAFDDLKTLTFETNCSVPLKLSHMDQLSQWSKRVPGRRVVWSNSPKLSISGEKWEDAIRPEIAFMQNRVFNSYQYFKFVCEPTPESFDEVEKAMKEYYNAGISNKTEIWIMPVGATLEQQHEVDYKVAQMCLDRGYNVSFRAHIYAFGNKVGV